MNEIDFNRLISDMEAVEEQLPAFMDHTAKRPPEISRVNALAEQMLSLVIADPRRLRESSVPLSRAELDGLFFAICDLIRPLTDLKEQTATEIMLDLPKIKSQVIKDAIAIYEGDPAASSVDEVVLCYPGFYATAIHRIAHSFFLRGVPYVPRIMTEIAHSKTGIDIHPGAKIGDSFCIDHGTGVVIGETAVIGDRVKIYQGVTVGAKSVERDCFGMPIKGKKRHPTIGNDCIIYAGATILGGDTVIGDGCVIGGNVWLIRSVAPGTKVYYNPEGNKK